MFLTGDKVWHIGNMWIKLEEVEIVSERKQSNDICFYNVKGITLVGHFNAKEKDLFSTKEEAIAEIQKRKETKIQKISEDIDSVEDLLKMMLKCMHCGEYTNWEKIEVAKKKAKELLGVDLK